jgi:subtilisin family serine protease
LLVLAFSGPAGAGAPTVSNELSAQAAAVGTVRAIVHLNVATMPEGALSHAQAVGAQRRAIASFRAAVRAALAGRLHRVHREYGAVPFMAVEVGPDALAALAASTHVAGVYPDRLYRTSLYQSVPLIQADQAWAQGFDGTGSMVAILDTGVDGSHPFLAGKVITEACYSGNGNCPNGTTTQTGTGAALPCTYAPSGCRHGTHVAGIAAGANGTFSGAPFSGVAKGASILAIQVFSRFTGAVCGSGEDPCALAYTSDILAGLEHVYDLRNQYQIASANLSLGGSLYSSTAQCDAANPGYKAIIDTLRAAGIATVAAAGNNGSPTGLSAPACISSAISVGATSKTDQIASFSNSASFLSLLAPGVSIYSSVPGGGFAYLSGTSMATPHVTGAWAILKAKNPGATVDQVLDALTTAGVLLTDSRNMVTKPRIDVAGALALIPAQGAPLTLMSLAPDVGHPSPQPVGATITFTATFTGGTAPYQTKWWVWDGTSWSVGQNWATTTTFAWTPAAPGTYVIGVWGRNAGNTVDYPDTLQASGTVVFTIQQ